MQQRRVHLASSCGAQFKAFRFTEVLAVQFCGPALRFEEIWACGSSSFRTKGPSTQASYTSPKSFTESTCCHSPKFSIIWCCRFLYFNGKILLELKTVQHNAKQDHEQTAGGLRTTSKCVRCGLLIFRSVVW